MKRLLASALAASMALIAVPAFATEDSSASSSSSSSSARMVREERCKRFSNGDDYERCVRLIHRLPMRDGMSADREESSSSASDGSDWKWTNITSRIEKKLKGTIKFVSVMAKQFCKDRTDESDTTSRECMGRFKAHLQESVDAMIDEAFRGDLPSSR